MTRYVHTFIAYQHHMLRVSETDLRTVRSEFVEVFRSHRADFAVEFARQSTYRVVVKAAGTIVFDNGRAPQYTNLLPEHSVEEIQ